MSTIYKKLPNDKFRFLTSFIIIIISILTVFLISFYNISAIFMIFGKGDLQLKSFNKTVEFVYDNNKNYTNISIEGSEYNGTLKYDTSDDIAKFIIFSKDNKPVRIHCQIDIQNFASSGLTSKYKSIDNVLNPLFINKDLLASKISLIRLFSKLAISKLTTGKLYTTTSPINNMTTELSIDKNYLIISMNST